MNNLKSKTKLAWLGVLVLAAVFTACQEDDDPATTGGNDKNVPPITQRTLRKDITADTTMKDVVSDPKECDCVVAGQVEVRAKLTIEPGVVMCFESDQSLVIDEEGTLIAKGAADKKIVFTGKEKIKGYWRGILFFSSDVRNELDHVEISYGGSSPVSNTWLDAKANLAVAYLDGGRVKLTNSLVANSGGYGMVVQNGGIIQAFAGNAFQDNALVGLLLPAGQVSKLDAATAFTGGNGEDGVAVFASILNEPTEAVWPAFADGSGYLVKRNGNDNTIQVRSGLKIREGATFRFEPGLGLSIAESGYLSAVGTAAKRITFTGAVQTEASWRGILFFSANPLNELSYTDVAYGGSSAVSNTWFDRKANVGLVFSDTKLKLTNSAIKNSGGYGVAAKNGAGLTHSGNTFGGNALDDMRINF